LMTLRHTHLTAQPLEAIANRIDHQSNFRGDGTRNRQESVCAGQKSPAPFQWRRRLRDGPLESSDKCVAMAKPKGRGICHSVRVANHLFEP
jgi:hypothetical protein